MQSRHTFDKVPAGSKSREKLMHTTVQHWLGARAQARTRADSAEIAVPLRGLSAVVDLPDLRRPCDIYTLV